MRQKVATQRTHNRGITDNDGGTHLYSFHMQKKMYFPESESSELC